MKVAGSNPAIGIVFYTKNASKGIWCSGITRHFDCLEPSSSLGIPVCRIEKFGLSRQVHALKIGGSNPSSAIKNHHNNSFRLRHSCPYHFLRSGVMVNKRIDELFKIKSKTKPNYLEQCMAEFYFNN